MKVICDCGGECIPTMDSEGKMTFEFPVARISMMGLLRYELRAIWFACPDCEKSFMMLPRVSPIEDQRAVFIEDENE